MNEKHEPRINFMECLIDPLGGKAETELRDSNMVKRSKENQNPLKGRAFIVGSLKDNSLHFTDHGKGNHPTPSPPFWILSPTQVLKSETTNPHRQGAAQHS
ncbi:transposase [Sesbania bispinosa]|nr:transposase [Sesbania bispinosa]